MSDHAAKEEGDPSRTKTTSQHDADVGSNDQEHHHEHQDQHQYQYPQRPFATLHRRRSTLLSHPISDPVNGTSLVCGLLAGICQAGLFNPYDRALYLSVRDHRPFLHRANFQNPYLGFSQSIGGRAIQGGLYFPMEHYFLRQWNADNNSGGIMMSGSSSSSTAASFASDPRQNFLAGTAAGAVNACLINPLSAVKYKTWGRTVNRGVAYEVAHMLRQTSWRPFFNGLVPTLARDVVFGGCYTYLRLQLQFGWWNSEAPIHANSNSNSRKWFANMAAAALATVVSGPFNYVRNVQFATPSHQTADGMWHVLHQLVRETRAQGPTLRQLQFLQQRLRIGWGTARVAVGMSLAHAVYDWLHERAAAVARQR